MEKKDFWKTLDLLINIDWRKSRKDNIARDIDEMYDEIMSKPEPNNNYNSNNNQDNIENDLGMGGDPLLGHTFQSDVTSPIDQQKRQVMFLLRSNGSSGYSSLTESTDSDSDALSLHAQPIVQCCHSWFSHPHVKLRLEKLMGSNMVRMTDRKYMQRLQNRIQEDYVDNIHKRISEREAKERDREKRLVLTGSIPFDQAPKEMFMHPVLVIDRYCQKIITERRTKYKVPGVIIPKMIYPDPSKDAFSGLTIARGHRFNPRNNTLLTKMNYATSSSYEENVDRGYMFTEEDYERLKYESPLIKQLKTAETVEEMYWLAEQILGPVKNLPSPVTASASFTKTVMA